MCSVNTDNRTLPINQIIMMETHLSHLGNFGAISITGRYDILGPN